MNQATEKGNGIDLRPEWGIFIPSVLVIILISIPAVLYPKAAEEVVSAIYQPFAANFGTLYLWITVGLIILCVYFACSRYGDIKFGDPSVPGWPGRSCSGRSSSPCGTSCSHRNTQRP
mgnify:CR=1 FL=1